MCVQKMALKPARKHRRDEEIGLASCNSAGFPEHWSIWWQSNGPFCARSLEEQIPPSPSKIKQILMSFPCQTQSLSAVSGSEWSFRRNLKDNYKIMCVFWLSCNRQKRSARLTFWKPAVLKGVCSVQSRQQERKEVLQNFKLYLPKEGAGTAWVYCCTTPLIMEVRR